MGKIYTVPSSAPGCWSCHRVTLGAGDPSMLASVRQPRSWLRHHGWRPPASCLPNFLLSLFCAFHPPPLPPRDRRTEFPLLLLTGNTFLTPLLFGLCLFPAPPSECNRSLPVTFFPAFLPLEEGLACFFRRFYLLLCFLWPLLPPVCSALDLCDNHQSHNPCRIPWGKEC